MSLRTVDISQRRTKPDIPSAVECRVDLDISSLPSAIGWSPLARLRRSCFGSALRLLIADVRSLPHRISHSFEIGAWERRGGMGKGPQVFDGIRWFQPDRRAYISHMQETQARFPFLTIFDLHLVSRSLMAGMELGVRTCTEQSQTEIRSCASPATDDSRPLQQAQQDSTRDLLAQLPSQALRDELARRERSCTKQNRGSQQPLDSPTSLNGRSLNE